MLSSVPTGADAVVEDPTELTAEPARDVFAFSGCGWMIPYHVGVAHALLAAGRLHAHTRFVGASGGALVGALLACGADPEDIMADVIAHAEASRRDGYWLRLRKTLFDVLEARLPPDAHERCTGRLSVAVTRVWPRPRLRPVYVRRFETRADLIAATLGSCMIPGWFDHGLTARVGKMRVLDGGAWHLVPRVAGAIKISPFVPPYARSHGVKIDIGPALTPAFDLSPKELMRLCFTPPSRADMTTVHDWGVRATEVWLQNDPRGAPLCHVGEPLPMLGRGWGQDLQETQELEHGKW